MLNIGDKFIVTNTDHARKKKYIGQVFTVKKINPNGENAYHVPHYGVKEPSEYFIFKEDEIEPICDENIKKKIVITTDGKTTTARMYDGNTLIKASCAKLHPDDTFGFEIGAKAAFNRLIPEDKKPEFAPHLEADGEHYGIIGKQTKYTDAIGRPLVVGDTVELYDNNCEFYGESVVVENQKEMFVSGIRGVCKGENGKIKNEWKIIKKRSYNEVKDGESVDNILYIKTEKE